MPTLTRRAAISGAFTLCASAAQAATIVPVYFYPPEHRWPSGRNPTGAMALDAAQVTTRIALPDGAAGVAISIFWDTISSGPDAYDFSLIDGALDYWRRRGKRVIVSVATLGYPYRALGETDALRTPTPDWAMRRVATYRHRSRVIGVIGEPDVDATHPDFRDPRFAGLAADLARRLGARYDGNPTIAQWRIATGIGGEDNAVVGTLASPMPGYTESQWVDFTERALPPFFDAFRRTRLEFDIGRLSGIARRGGRARAARVQAILDTLRAHDVLLAFDGLQTESLNDLRDERALAHLTFQYLLDYQRRGGGIGLEAYAPMYNPKMADVGAMMTVLGAMRPERLVMFDDLGRDVLDRTIAAPGADAARAFWGRLTWG